MQGVMKKFSGCCLCFWALCSSASAEILDYNHAFSYTEIGAEIISYGEKTTVSGYPLNMEAVVVNVAQRSGGYTPVSEFGGFYIQTATTLDPLSANEQWDIQPFGVVQENERKVRWNELNVLYSQLFRDSGYHLVAGASIATLSFIRSAFTKGVGATAFENAVGTPLNIFPGAISEDSTHVTANIGFRYDSTFLDPDETSRFLWGVSAGVPLYYKVENSNFPGTTWVEYFKGYDVAANISYGFQVYEKFMLSMSAEGLYKRRPETHGIAVSGGVGRIPEVTIWNVRLAAGIEWSY